MTTGEQAASTPLWLSIEEKFLGLDAQRSNRLRANSTMQVIMFPIMGATCFS